MAPESQFGLDAVFDSHYPKLIQSHDLRCQVGFTAEVSIGFPDPQGQPFLKQPERRRGSGRR